MKEKILLAALMMFSFAGFLTIITIITKTFSPETLGADMMIAARIYSVATTLGVTGICTGLIGAIYPKGK